MTTKQVYDKLSVECNIIIIIINKLQILIALQFIKWPVDYALVFVVVLSIFNTILTGYMGFNQHNQIVNIATL